MASPSSAGPFSAGVPSGSSTSSAGRGGTAPASGGVAPSLPPRSIVIDFNALTRGAAVQQFFKSLFTMLTQPRFEDLLNVPVDEHGKVAQVSPDNVLLFGASTMKWDEFKVILSPVSTIFLLPLVIGFSGPNSNDLVPYEVLDPLSFLDNHLLFPMGVFVLSTRIAGEIVLLYGGTILPMSPNAAPYYGLRDSEIGAEWIVPSPSAKTIPSEDLDLSLLNVIIPSGNVKANLKALL